MAGPAGGESPGLLPARGEPALHAVLRAPSSRADAAIGTDAQIEAHAAVLEYPQTIVQPVIPPVRLEFPILSLNPGLRQRCVAPRALFMTVWRPSTRSAENSCGIRQG